MQVYQMCRFVYPWPQSGQNSSISTRTHPVALLEPPSLHSPSLILTSTHFPFLDFVNSEMSHKREHEACNLSGFLFFSLSLSLQSFIPIVHVSGSFLLLSSIPCYGCIRLFNHSFTEGHLGGSPLGAVTNKAAMRIQIQVFV